MGEVLLWKPVLWALRVSILGGIAGASWIAILYFWRYTSRRNIKLLTGADLPDVKQVTILGQKVILQDDKQEDMKVALKALGGAVSGLVADVDSVKREIEGRD